MGELKATLERPEANANGSRNIDFGSLRLPLPAWSIPLLGVVAVLYAALSLLSEPLQTVYSRYLSGKVEMQDQMEAYRHYSEMPTAEVSKATDDGTLEAKFYTDGCISVSWRRAGSSAPPRPHFFRSHATAEPPSAAAIRAVEAGVQAAGIGSFGATAGDAGSAGTGGSCVNPHPGPFDSSYGSRNGCWVQVWRRFQDGCVHYQLFNSCANVWDVNPDGSPRVFWTECRH